MSTSVSVTRIERMRDVDLPALRAYLNDHRDATVFHTPEWFATIRDAYGHVCDYWIARSGSAIVGAFPVLVVRAPLLGSKMVAQGYQMDSGLPLAESPEIARDLVRAAASEAARRGVRYLEVRSLSAAPELVAEGYTEIVTSLVTTIVELAGKTPAVRRSHRSGARVAGERGVSIVRSESAEDLRRFQKMYLREGRAMGSPQAGWRFFESLHRNASSLYTLYLAMHGGRPIAGLVTVGDRKVVFARHAAWSSAQALALNANRALCWRAIQDAAGAGADRFNLGISWERDAGLILWKEGWAGTTVPVRLYVRPIRGSAPNPGEYLGGYQLARAIWRRLPLPVAHLGGQLVTRWVC